MRWSTARPPRTGKQAVDPRRGAKGAVRGVAIRALCVLAVVVAWIGGVSYAAAAVAVEDTPVAASPIGTLARTRADCRVLGVDQAGQATRFRAVNLSDRALRCVLDGMLAPEYLSGDIAGTWPLDGRKRAHWDRVTAEWFRNPDPAVGLDVTIRVEP
ncbi:hypothetical protein [Umezawaea tangerina]|uniref:Uncharacterized protein n=1 Tax=Umezawaea tangerina TaxID=84725 RepID=A0A2T0TKL7_9PSEU|nr:hypothetical protein [Umezawaea tangerina]PRY46161.1 hypothetical protein CLV43_101431 [Umezawaea tangerina]